MARNRRQHAPRDRKRPFAFKVPEPPCTPKPPRPAPPPSPAGSGCDAGTGWERYKRILRGGR